jgi:hypothetical protein
MTKTALAELPVWIREFNGDAVEKMEKRELIPHVAFASGIAIGQAMKIDEMQQQLDEMTEMLEIARAFQREKDALLLEECLLPNAADTLRLSEL